VKAFEKHGISVKVRMGKCIVCHAMFIVPHASKNGRPARSTFGGWPGKPMPCIYSGVCKRSEIGRFALEKRIRPTSINTQNEEFLSGFRMERQNGPNKNPNPDQKIDPSFHVQEIWIEINILFL